MEERGRKGGISTSPHDDDAERRDALSSPIYAPTLAPTLAPTRWTIRTPGDEPE